VDAALQAKFVGDILLTSPDKPVASHINSKYQDRVLLLQRDPKLARINTQVTETIIDALQFYCQNHPAPEWVLVLYIESPFRDADYIDKAINTMQLYDVDAVDGVRLDDSLFYIHRGDGLEPWAQENGLRLEQKSLYRRAGGLHLIKRKFLIQHKKMVGGRIGHFLLDQKAAFAIQTDLDWHLAKVLAKID
jgi:CMP-N-acetylneuraminic acid synthetase